MNKENDENENEQTMHSTHWESYFIKQRQGSAFYIQHTVNMT